jgi:outer membrane protein
MAANDDFSYYEVCRMKNTMLVSMLLLAGVLAGAAAHAEESPWLVRGRILDMQVKNGNDPLSAAGEVKAENKVFPEVDFTYFITPNIAAELILTYPQSHKVTLGGKDIGSVKHLPPTLTLQYHFLPTGDIRPYVGAGINYTRFMDVNLDAGRALGGSIPLSTDTDSFGLAAQAGVDFKVAPQWFLNLDAKYVQIATHVKFQSDGSTVTNLKIDPWLLSVGLGYRF